MLILPKNITRRQIHKLAAEKYNLRVCKKTVDNWCNRGAFGDCVGCRFGKLYNLRRVKFALKIKSETGELPDDLPSRS